MCVECIRVFVLDLPLMRNWWHLLMRGAPPPPLQHNGAGGWNEGNSNSAVVHAVAVAMLLYLPVWNRTVLVVAWLFTPSGSSGPMTLITGTNLTGIEMGTVSDGLRTMVTFSGVRREADGRRVVCVTVFSSGVISKPATLTIQREL